MNLDTFLGQAAEVGESDSEGAFSVSPQVMLERLAASLLVDLSMAPLVAVSAAVGAGASALDLKPARRGLVFSFSMLEPPLENGRALYSGPARQLLVAAAVWKEQARKVGLIFPLQGIQLSLSPKLELAAYRGQARTVQLMVEGKTPPGQALLTLLQRHCGLCSLPLSVEGRPVSSSLQGFCGDDAFWTCSVPESLRPRGEPLLESETAVLLARSRLAKPHWVAVVGGISYPFLLPGAGGVKGIVWSDRLRTDLSLTRLVQDSCWLDLRDELLRLALLSRLTSLPLHHLPESVPRL